MAKAAEEGDDADASDIVFVNGEFDALLEDLSHILEICGEDRAVACADLKKIRERLFEKEVLGRPYHSLRVVHQ